MTRLKTKNVPIGTAPCPFTKCELVCPVFRFRAWSENEKRKRQAGRLYVVCPDHGMNQNQAWLEKNATITDAHVNDPPAAEPEPTDPPAEPENDAASSRVPDDPDEGEATPSPENADNDGFGFFK